MLSGTLPLTLLGLINVVLALLLAVVFAGAMRRGPRLVWASVAVAVVAELWVIYWAVVAHRAKHAVLFGGLAVIALIAAAFSRPEAAEAPPAAVGQRGKRA